MEEGKYLGILTKQWRAGYWWSQTCWELNKPMLSWLLNSMELKTSFGLHLLSCAKEIDMFWELHSDQNNIVDIYELYQEIENLRGECFVFEYYMKLHRLWKESTCLGEVKFIVLRRTRAKQRLEKKKKMIWITGWLEPSCCVYLCSDSWELYCNLAVHKSTSVVVHRCLLLGRDVAGLAISTHMKQITPCHYCDTFHTRKTVC